MDNESFKVIIQPAITVVGWLVIILWGLKQIKLTSSKNLELQRKLIRENYERGLANEVINIYKDVIISIDNLLQRCNNFTANLSLENSEYKEKINFSASTLVDPVNQAYNCLGRDIYRLEMWIKISSPSLPHSEAIQHCIDEYNKKFKMSTSNSDENLWIGFQGFLVAYQSGSLKKKKGLFDHWKKMGNSLILIRDKLTDAIVDVNKELIKAYNHSVQMNADQR